MTFYVCLLLPPLTRMVPLTALHLLFCCLLVFELGIFSVTNRVRTQLWETLGIKQMRGFTGVSCSRSLFSVLQNHQSLPLRINQMQPVDSDGCPYLAAYHSAGFLSISPLAVVGLTQFFSLISFCSFRLLNSFWKAIIRGYLSPAKEGLQ